MRNPLNSDFGINNERQDYKTCKLRVGTVGGRRANRGDEGTRLMGFIYIHEIEW
jgi:hypothetical protein